MALTLFTNITEQLTDLEKEKLVPILLRLLNPTTSAARMKGSWLAGMFKSMGYPVSDVRIRKMVNYIRVTNAAKPRVLIGTSTGYYLTCSISDVDEQIRSLQERMDSMAAALDAIKSQRLNLVHK